MLIISEYITPAQAIASLRWPKMRELHTMETDARYEILRYIADRFPSICFGRFGLLEVAPFVMRLT